MKPGAVWGANRRCAPVQRCPWPSRPMMATNDIEHSKGLPLNEELPALFEIDRGAASSVEHSVAR